MIFGFVLVTSVTILAQEYQIDYSPKTKGVSRAEACSQWQIRKYNLEITDQDLSTLNKDISAEEYVPCTVTTDYNGFSPKTFRGAGCRYKGAVGSLLNCLDQVTGRPNGKCRKFSLKLDGNKYRIDDQKIDGMKKINLHGMGMDKSLVSERFAYNFIKEEMGIAVSCAAHAEVFVNGRFDGLYTFVQDPGSGLTKDFPDFKADNNKGKGGLYKDFWFLPEQNSWEWLEENHKSGKNEHAFMMEVANAINVGSETECSVVNQYFDLDVFAKVTAVNDFIGQNDDWRIRHNFYWYVRDDWRGKQLVMIPWDYDRLTEVGSGAVVRRQYGQWLSPVSSCRAGYDSSLAVTNFQSALQKEIFERRKAAMPAIVGTNINCDKITRMMANCLSDKYDTYFNELKVKFPVEELEKKLDAYVAEIQPIVSADAGYPAYEFNAAVQQLKSNLRAAPSLAPKKPAYNDYGLSGDFNFGVSQAQGAGGFSYGAVPSFNQFGNTGMNKFGTSSATPSYQPYAQPNQYQYTQTNQYTQPSFNFQQSFNVPQYNQFPVFNQWGR